jgi:hypothetical protein
VLHKRVTLKEKFIVSPDVGVQMLLGYRLPSSRALDGQPF